MQDKEQASKLALRKNNCLKYIYPQNLSICREYKEHMKFRRIKISERKERKSKDRPTSSWMKIMKSMISTFEHLLINYL